MCIITMLLVRVYTVNCNSAWCGAWSLIPCRCSNKCVDLIGRAIHMAGPLNVYDVYDDCSGDFALPPVFRAKWAHIQIVIVPTSHGCGWTSFIQPSVWHQYVHTYVHVWLWILSWSIYLSYIWRQSHASTYVRTYINVLYVLSTLCACTYVQCVWLYSRMCGQVSSRGDQLYYVCILHMQCGSSKSTLQLFCGNKSWWIKG